MSFAVPLLEIPARLRPGCGGQREAAPPATVTENINRRSAPWEAHLIRRVARGDREAYGWLFDRYAKPLYSFVIRILYDRCEAEDVLQEVFLTIWEKASSFDEAAGQPFSWAVTITRNKAIDCLRARQRRLPMCGENPGGLAVAETAGETQPHGNAQRDRTMQISLAVNKLNNAQRRPIELAFFGGYTQNEIAEALGEPLGTIKSRIRRGILRLREDLRVCPDWQPPNHNAL